MKKLIISLSLSCTAFSGFSQQRVESVIKNNQPLNTSTERTPILNPYFIPACATTNPGWLLGGNMISSTPMPPGYNFVGGGQVLGTCDNYNLVLEAGGLQSMWLLTSGQIGIGTSGPLGMLDILTPGSMGGLNILNGTTASSTNVFSVGADGSTIINMLGTSDNPLTVTGSNSTAVNTYFSNATGYKTFFVEQAIGAGSYNGIVKKNDNAIIWDNGTNGNNTSGGNNGLVLASWNGRGIRIDGATGDLGIGNASPLAQLDINSTGNVNNTAIKVEGVSNNTIFTMATDGTTLINTTSTNNSPLIIQNSTFSTSNKNIFEVTTNGQLNLHYNLGSNTKVINVVDNSSGTSNFAVYQNGYVYSRELVVMATGSVFPDYVFSSDYKLMPLGDIKQYTDKYHHLPNMPTAKEVEEKGANVGEIQRVSVEKIEELYLHMIEMNKKLERLEKENVELKSEITKIKSK